MNVRMVCALKTDFHDAFASSLADSLDILIDGYHFQWDLGNGCFTIRESNEVFSRICLPIYSGDDVVLISHYSFANVYGQQKTQNSKIYCLTDPTHNPATIATDIVRFLHNTLPYDEAIDTDYLGDK